MVHNKYTSIENIRNESDVEQFFVIKLLYDLGYSDDYIETKTTIQDLSIGKGKKKKKYRPDYIVYYDKEHKVPIIIIDAKSPDETALEGISDSQLYVSNIRRTLTNPKPDQYCIGTNGKELIVKHFESNDILISLSFDDFKNNNDKFNTLISLIHIEKIQPFHIETSKYFLIKKPSISEITTIFDECHDYIWRTEQRSPTSAFYEFVKIMFIKLYYDKKLHDDMNSVSSPTNEIYLENKKIIFSVNWIEEQEDVEINPVNTILFKNLRKELEEEIREGKKKRIFDKNEEIDLLPSTIKEIVKYLEHYDLFGIDDDLNGKLFQTFLTATMRGKDLGQFFTPRTVVDFITELADLKVFIDHIEKVLDACCGTGGFLIEAMADMRDKIDRMKHISSSKKEKLVNELILESLYGVDSGKDPPLARIARINMYLHGDGGSRIYYANALDKEHIIEIGINEEIKRERKELKNIFEKNEVFNVVLTNPPFAMKYSKDKSSDRRLLKQYEIAKKEGTDKLYASSQSNILFLERYMELLKPGGRLLTVIDDTPLNGSGAAAKRYRNYIRKYFIIKAVISLPTNAFKLTEAGSKTSVLFLEKKIDDKEEQHDVFMAISENVGHNNFGKPTPDLNDLPQILMKYNEYIKLGTVEQSDNIFVVSSDNMIDEINPFFHAPEFKRIHNTLISTEKNGLIKIKKGKDMPIVKDVSKTFKISNKTNIFKYFEVGDITIDGSIVNYKEDILKNLPTRAKKLLKENDVIMARNISSLGKITIIPKEFDNHFCSDGFIVFRMKNIDDAYLLVGLLRMDIIQKQMYYSQRESVQPDIKQPVALTR